MKSVILSRGTLVEGAEFTRELQDFFSTQERRLDILIKAPGLQISDQIGRKPH